MVRLPSAVPALADFPAPLVSVWLRPGAFNSAMAAPPTQLTFASACALSAKLLPWLCKFVRESRGVHLVVRHHGTSKWAFSVEKFQVTIFRYTQRT
jgi:hypothetical protein